jgi:hypothetical protein
MHRREEGASDLHAFGHARPLHLALRGNIEHAPEAIALSLMNNLAYAAGQKPLWEYGYYAGSFGEYDMNAVRESRP